MKRLFEVIAQGQAHFFDNKDAAKAFRNDGAGRVVSLGPDHWRYGLKGNPKTHSHSARSGGHGNGFPRKARRFN